MPDIPWDAGTEKLKMQYHNKATDETIDLYGEDAQNHCKNCPYGYTDSDGDVTCMAGISNILIDDDTADSDCVCSI